MAEYEEIYHDEHDRLYGPTLRRIHPSELLATAGPEQPESEALNDSAPPPVKPLCGEAPLKNASRGTWAEYARCLGVGFTQSDGRDAIVTLVERHMEEK